MNIRKIFTTLFITASIYAAAQNKTTPDTIVGIINPADVTVITKTDGKQVITISVIDNDDMSDMSTDASSIPSFFDFTQPKRWNLNRLLSTNTRRYRRSYVNTEYFRGFYAGGIIPLGSNSPVKTGWEIGLSNFVRGEWSGGSKYPSVSIGAGFGWEILNMDRGCILEKMYGRLMVVPAPEGSRKIKSRIKNFHFTVPLSLKLPLSRSFGLTLTGELHLNTYTTASSSWRMENGSKVSNSMKGLHQRIATIDMKAALGWFNSIGVYVNYSPMKKWIDGYGPEYKTLSVGATIPL